MNKVILSVEEFMRTLKPGDKFWHMTSMYDAPVGIEGPITIHRFERDKEGSPIVIYKDKFLIPNQVVDREYWVSDLTNRWRGVFLNEEDARAYFEERKQAYATDPELIAEVEACKERVAAAENDYDFDYDKDYFPFQ